MRRLLFVGMVLVQINSAATAQPYENSRDVADEHNQRKFPGQGTVADWHRAEARSAEALDAFHQKRFDDAITGTEEAIKMYPFEADFYNQLAIVLWQRNKTGDIERGISNERKATTIRPDTCMFWDNLGKALAGVNKLEEARNALLHASRCRTTPEKLAEIKANIQLIDQGLAQNSGARTR